MTMETLSSNDLLNFNICTSQPTTNHNFVQNPHTPILTHKEDKKCHLMATNDSFIHDSQNSAAAIPPSPSLEAQGRRKRRRRGRACKNKEESENQRMNHITVERNRRKQMNEHLAILRSLMPPSYVQRGDQASIVGGAIEFVKELEHILQSLEAQKFLTFEQNASSDSSPTTCVTSAAGPTVLRAPFSQFFAESQYPCSQSLNKFTSKSNGDIADVEVTLIETHANIRILSRRRVRQLSKLVAGFHSFCLTILHLNLNALDPLVLYSISAKVEEGCQLSCAEEIASAVHHMLRIIEEEGLLNVDSVTLHSPFTP